MLGVPALLLGSSAVLYEAWLLPRWEALEKKALEMAKLPPEDPPNSYREPDGFCRDAVELTPEFRAVIEEARALATKELEGVERGMGFTHHSDRTLQKILQEKFRIRWRTRREMNPDVCID